MRTIWTIGHSTHPFDEFIEMLNSFNIELLADIRNFPGSRGYPQYNKESLEFELPNRGIGYIHLKELGGRRKPAPDSKNTRWRHEAFRGYADYMETTEFKNAIDKLCHLALSKPTAFMCSEAVWWSCHRSLVSDYLKVRGWTVIHIMGVNKASEHPYTSAAIVVNGELHYDEPELF